MTKKHFDIVGLDSAILMNPKIWEASGHLTSGFADELVECKNCHKRFRLDEVLKNVCPECQGEITKPRKFNLMMKSYVGPVEEKASLVYLRAETCQGIYVNFKNILTSLRLKIPFGVAQIGKAFRNEITPRDFIYRMREFEQMEMEWFCHPKEADEYFEFFRKERMKWYLDLGIKKENLREREVEKEERAHYARRQIDIEYKFPFGWREIEGIHNRGDWDLLNHSKYSKEDLSYFDEEKKERYFPYIIETSVGVERSLFAFLCDAYTEIKGGRTKTTKATKEVEVLLKISKKLAPIKVAVFPLVKNKPQIVKLAQEVYKLVKPHFVCQYDEVGSIGRRYRRADEIGVPYALTIDFESIKNQDLTIRDRDTMEQKRVKIEEVVDYLKKVLND
jgi:glycyl-tRNA synthetase